MLNVLTAPKRVCILLIFLCYFISSTNELNPLTIINKVKKSTLLFLFILLALTPGNAQQDPITSNYMFHTLSFNPGYAGSSGMICATALNRQQWLGFEGAPSTNDLDILTLNVLEEYLEEFPGCLIVATHDRYFLDKIVDHLFVFEGNGKIKDYNGKYSDYRWEDKQRKKEERQRSLRNKSLQSSPPAC